MLCIGTLLRVRGAVISSEKKKVGFSGFFFILNPLNKFLQKKKLEKGKLGLHTSNFKCPYSLFLYFSVTYCKSCTQESW